MAALLLLSAVGLSWEITLSRLASATLSYHYAFVAVSLAVGGIGLGAALVCASSAGALPRLAAWYAAATAVVFIVAPPLVSPLVAWASLGGLILLAMPPFIGIGAALTAVFRSVPRLAPSFYSADLAGAGLGAIGTVMALNITGPFGLLFVLGMLSAAASWLLQHEAAQARESQEVTPTRQRGSARFGLPALSALLLAAGLAGVVGQARWALFSIDYRQMSTAPPDKTIVPVLRNPSNAARIIDTRWNAFARTDVVKTSDPTERLIFTDGGAGTYMLRWNGRVQSQEGLRTDLETLSFLLGPHRNVLVIGSGGGIDVVRALVAGAKHVTAVDWNAAAVAAVRRERRYNGNVLDGPDVTTVVDDGRHFLAGDKHRYDTILLNLVYTGAEQGTSNALAENYVFTEQAFDEYLKHLTLNGRVGIVSHQALEGLRAFTTGVETLHHQGLGYPEAMQRAALLMTNNQTPQSRPTITVVQRAAFDLRELTMLRSRGNADLNLHPLYVPNFYQGAFGGVVEGTQTLAQFLAGSDYNVGPTSDDQPFFFDLNPGLPEGMDMALRYTALLLLGIMVLAVLLGWTPRAQGSSLSVWFLALYMALLGTGFMCVEIPLIQRFILVLGEPTLALSVVLATLLMAASLGSLLAGLGFARGLPLALAPLAVALVAFAMRIVLPATQNTLLSMPRTEAVAGSIFLLVPLGIVLGMPFPLGLRFAAQVAPTSIALFWAISAGFSMLGSAVAALVAIKLGFSAVLLLGAVLYGAGAVAMYLAATRVPLRAREVPSSAPPALAQSHT